MKVEIFQYRDKRYALVEEKPFENDMVNILKVDYLIFLESAFYYDYKATTYDSKGECFSLSSLAVIAHYKKCNRLILAYKNQNYEIFNNEKSTYLVLDAPRIINKYKDKNQCDYYFIKFDNKYYLFAFNQISKKELVCLRRKKKFDYYIILNEDGTFESEIETFVSLILKEYLFSFLNQSDSLSLSMKCLFQKNLLVEVNEVKYLYKSYLKK